MQSVFLKSFFFVFVSLSFRLLPQVELKTKIKTAWDCRHLLGFPLQSQRLPFFMLLHGEKWNPPAFEYIHSTFNSSEIVLYLFFISLRKFLLIDAGILNELIRRRWIDANTAPHRRRLMCFWWLFLVPGAIFGGNFTRKLAAKTLAKSFFNSIPCAAKTTFSFLSKIMEN